MEEAACRPQSCLSSRDSSLAEVPANAAGEKKEEAVSTKAVSATTMTYFSAKRQELYCFVLDCHRQQKRWEAILLAERPRYCLSEG